MAPMQPAPIIRRSSQRAGRDRGFTLIEAALATIIIGVGVLAVVEAQHSFLERNAWSSHGATATYLGTEIRELSKPFPRHDRFSGGIYFVDPNDVSTFDGWGPELGEDDPIDLDDLDDLDGAVFGSATEFPDGFVMTQRYDGPINALGEVIPETNYDGSTRVITGEGDEVVEVAMQGWTQIVQVDKVEPTDITDLVADNAELRSGSNVLRAVDRYPLRITVTVLRQPDPTRPPEVMNTLSWVVTP